MHFLHKKFCLSNFRVLVKLCSLPSSSRQCLRLASLNVMVKDLEVIETLGCVTVIASDKTAQGPDLC